MRLLHVIPSVADRYGGPSAAVRGMTRALAAEGMDVTIATTNADGPQALDVPIGVPLIEQGVTYHYFPRTLPGEWKFSWPLWRWLVANVHEYDVVTVHALFSYATIPGCRTSYRRGVPYIVRPLGTLGDWSLRQRRWKKAPYLALVERRHLERASAIHVTSDAEHASVAALGFGEKARVIPLGVDAGKPTRRTLRGGPLRLLYLSRLHPGKNLPTLFGAVRHARASGADVVLTVAGAGEPDYSAFLRESVVANGVADCVDFVGHLSGAAKASAFADADVFVLPSAHENFGIAVVEALASGLAVVVSPHVGVAHEVHAASAGVISEVAEDELGGTLATLARERTTVARMGAAASQLARRRFSWTACARQLIDLYEDVALGAMDHRRPVARTGQSG